MSLFHQPKDYENVYEAAKAYVCHTLDLTCNPKYTPFSGGTWHVPIDEILCTDEQTRQDLVGDMLRLSRAIHDRAGKKLCQSLTWDDFADLLTLVELTE